MNTGVEVRELFSDDEVAATFEVMHQLRSHLLAADYVATIKRVRDSDGYRLAAVLDAGEVRCVAGFRVCEFLAYGKVLYVDDLITDQNARSRSYGKLMMDWLDDEAGRSGCENLHLDSAVHRAEAHRFYFRERMRISSFHFARTIHR